MFNLKLRDLRDLRGKIFFPILVAALPRWGLRGENLFFYFLVAAPPR